MKIKFKKILVHIVAVYYEMSDVTLSDDFDTRITHAFTAETVLFMSGFVVAAVLCLF